MKLKQRLLADILAESIYLSLINALVESPIKYLPAIYAEVSAICFNFIFLSECISQVICKKQNHVSQYFGACQSFTLNMYFGAL